MDVGDVEALLEELRRVLRSAAPEPMAVSVEDAAARLSVSPSTVRRLIGARKLLTVRIGGRVLVPTTELRRVTTPEQRLPAGRGPPEPVKARAAEMAKRIRRQD